MDKEQNKVREKDVIQQFNEMIVNKKYDKVIQSCLKLVQYNPNNFILFFFIAKSYFLKNDLAMCLKFLRNAYNTGCTNYNSLCEMGNLFVQINNFPEARVCFQKADFVKPNQFISHFNIGITYFKERKYAEALRFFKKAKTIEDNELVNYELGRSYYCIRDINNAKKHFENTVKINKNYQKGYLGIAAICELMNDKKQAEENYLKAITIAPDHVQSYLGLSSVKTFDSKNKDDKKLIQNIKFLAEKHKNNKKEYSIICYTLGKIHNDIKEFEAAFKYYVEANNSSTHYNELDLDSMRQSINLNIKYSQKIDFDNKGRTKLSHKPIFIVGMPRSGSTLTEQILLSHSKVGSVGESTVIDGILNKLLLNSAYNPNKAKSYCEIILDLSPAELDLYAAQYISLISKNNMDKEFIINKMPTNFAYSAFLLKLFPESIIINTKRHPLDIITSMYFIWFSDKNMGYACNLEEMAAYYKEYDKVMSHFHKMIPGRIYDNYYEELVNNSDKHIREIVNNCNLDWEDNCLDFYKQDNPVFTASKLQVKQNIYKNSIYKWKRYEKQLAPIRSILSDEINEYEEYISNKTS